MIITGTFEIANYIEAGLWAFIGLGFLIAAIRTPASRRQLLFVAVTFVLFGVSDIVEASTGAWWRPWWLLIWKGLCLIVLGGFLLQYRRKKRLAGAEVALKPGKHNC
jgi:hypothetical protein